MRIHRDLSFWARVALTAVVGVGLCFIAYWVSDLFAQTALIQEPATCRPHHCFCEHDAGHFPRQLTNSLSSFAFVFLGIWSLLSTREPMVGTPERKLKPLFAITMLFLGASSFFYHATLSFIGQFLDVFSMYTFGLLLLAGALYRAGRVGGWYAFGGFVFASVVFGVVQYLFPDARRILFVALVLPGIVLEMLPFVTGYRPSSKRVWSIYAGVGIMLVAYLIWTLDQVSAFCAPGSPMQGHAVWHVLTALAAFMIFLHYRMTPHVKS